MHITIEALDTKAVGPKVFILDRITDRDGSHCEWTQQLRLRADDCILSTWYEGHPCEKPDDHEAKARKTMLSAMAKEQQWQADIAALVVPS